MKLRKNDFWKLETGEPKSSQRRTKNAISAKPNALANMHAIAFFFMCNERGLRPRTPAANR